MKTGLASFAPHISVAVVVLLCSSQARLHSQAVSANITGTIEDSSGAAVPEAKVTAVESATGTRYSSTSTSQGRYDLVFVKPGRYEIQVEAPGFKRFSRSNLTVAISTTVRVDAVLQVGDVTETVSVTADVPLLQTDRAEVAQTFNTQMLTELPVANRNFQALAGLVAGVSPPVQSLPALNDPQGTTFFNANGQANSSNNTIVDGVSNLEPILGGSIYLPPPEMVQEVHVTTSNYSAEFGRVGGAMLNVSTKGGGNDVHGVLWAFNRVSALAARDFFNTVPRAKPVFGRNDFGASISGPIVRNKTFFSGTYQGRYQRSATTSTATVPDPAWLSGNFSAVPGLTLFDPLSGAANGSGRVQFPNNRIPADRISPIARQIAGYFPARNAPGFLNNYIVNLPVRNNGNIFDARVDHSFSDQTKFFAKTNTAHYDVTQAGVLGPVIGDGLNAKDYTITSTVSLTHAFSPTLLSEHRLGFNRMQSRISGIDMSTLTNQSLGIANPNPDAISSEGIASIQISGMPAIGTAVQYPLVYTDNLFDIVDTWSKVTGRHTLKWGAEIHRLRLEQQQAQGANLGSRGLFVFNPGTTQLPGGPGLGSFGAFGNSFAAFLLGATDQTGRTYLTTTPTNRQTQFAGFLADTLQLSRNLTLDLGLRYEIYTSVKPRAKGGASNYDPYTNTLLVAGYGDVGLSTGVETPFLNFAPRFGFAYRPTDKTVIRGGYGISYWTGRFGFTGGTLSTQFPVVYNIQVGQTGDFTVDGTLNSLPGVPFVPIPESGRITPAPEQAFFVMPRHNPVPYVQNYNLTIQRQLTSSLSADVGYVGNLGRQLPYNLSLNAAPPGTGRNGLPFLQQFGHASAISLRANGINSNYNSLQANLVKRMSSGLSFTIAYTFSKSLDYGSNQPSFVDNTNIRRHYGRSDFDRTHMLTISHIYDLPFGPGKPMLSSGVLAHVLGGWQLNGVFRHATGTPFTASADATACNCPGNGNFADAIAPVQILGGVGPGQKWFSPAAFAVPGPNRFGNAGRNTIEGPVLTNYDFSVFRNFRINERAKVEFRSEFYNLTNTPHFSNPARNVSAGTFGEITSTLSGYGNRQVQFALRLLF